VRQLRKIQGKFDKYESENREMKKENHALQLENEGLKRRVQVQATKVSPSPEKFVG